MDPRIAEIVDKFRHILNPECPTEIAVEVTNYLSEFYTTKDSLIALTLILDSCHEEPIRLQAAIALKTSILHNRTMISPPEIESMFQKLTFTVLEEKSPTIRGCLITCLTLLIDPSFTEWILNTLGQELKQDNLGAIVNLMELICKDPRAANNHEALGFVMSVLERCFDSGCIELSCDAFQFLVAARKSNFIRSLDFCWMKLLELFDVCQDDRQNMQRVTSLFNQLLDEEEALGPESYDALYMKTMSLFCGDVSDLEILRAVFSVVETLCEPDRLRWRITDRMFVDVANVAFKLVVCSFDQTDISKCQFFDSTMINLLDSENSESRMPILWDMCQQVAQTEAGKYAALSALRFTAQEGINFYETKCDELVEFITCCLMNPLEVIKTAAIESLSDFATIFSRWNVPGLNNLAKQVLLVVRHSPTEEWITQLSELLGSMHDTTEIFDDLIVELMNMVRSPAIPVCPAMLDCMTKLVEGATTSVHQYVGGLITIIDTCFQSPDDAFSEMVISAMGLLEALLRIHYREMVKTGTELYPFLKTKMHASNPGIVIAALSILQTVFESYPNSENIMWSEIDMDLLVEMAGKDLSAEFRDVIRVDAAPQPDKEPVNFQNRFQYAERSIRILALAVKMNETLFRQCGATVMDMAFLQIRSVEERCVTAGCKSLVDVVAAMLKYHAMTEEIACQIVVDLSKIIFINRDREGTLQPVYAVRTLLFDMNLPISNIAGVLSECAKCLCEGDPIVELGLEAAHLLRDIMRKAAREDPDGTLQCERYLCARLSSAGQNWNIVYLLAGISLEIPQQTPPQVKQNVFSLVTQVAAQDVTQTAALWLLGGLAVTDHEFVTPVIEKILSILKEAALRTNPCQRARENAVLGIMKYLVRFPGQREELLGLVFESLPLDPHITDRDAVTSEFLMWISKECAGQGCAREVVRVCVAWFLEGVEVGYLVTIRDIMTRLLPNADEARGFFETLCPNDPRAIQNLMDLLQ